MLKRSRQPAQQATGSSFVERRDFGSNPGALRMLMHVPPNVRRGAPLVVVLHGCTQYAQAYADGAGWTALANRCGFAVLAPEQSSANNPNRCFNWFQAGDTVRGSGEVASIAAMVAHACSSDELDAGQVFVTGLSAGGAMTMAMLAAYPDLFAGGGVVAGLPYGVANDVVQAMHAMRRTDGEPDDALGARLSDAAPRPARTPTLTVWQGDADHVVSAANARAICRQWREAYGLDAEHASATVGRRTRTVWTAARPGDARLELNIIQGLGHGTPLSATGAEGLGKAGPFLIEAGVSSTLEIARFWRLPLMQMTTSANRVVADDKSSGSAAQAGPTDGPGAIVMDAIVGRVPGQVAGVIAKALRSAGLLR